MSIAKWEGARKDIELSDESPMCPHGDLNSHLMFELKYIILKLK